MDLFSFATPVGTKPLGATAPASAPVWAVSGLLRALADTLQARFNPVRVRGEVSGFARAASGHCYFTLKDAQGQLRCAFFRRAAQASGVDLRDGLQVEVDGRIDVYGQRGELQLVVEAVRPAGQGDLYEQFVRLKAQLEAEGCFDPARKRPLPPFPRGIGVVTSLDAAALRDVATTLQRRVPHLPVTVFASPVQGDSAPDALCAALAQAYAHHRETGRCDVLLLVRGGGSLEDLWAFNTPQVVRAVVQAPMPVISGVGHETDVTLVDFAADLRAPTPTGAAERCAPGRDTLARELAQHAERLQQGLWRRLDGQAQGLDRLAQRLGRPSQRLAQEHTRLQALAHRQQRVAGLRLERSGAQIDRLTLAWSQARLRDRAQRRQQLDQWTAQLALLDPRTVLQRGYALLTDASGRAVTQVAGLAPGHALQAQLNDGAVDLTVRATRP